MAAQQNINQQSRPLQDDFQVTVRHGINKFHEYHLKSILALEHGFYMYGKMVARLVNITLIYKI